MFVLYFSSLLLLTEVYWSTGALTFTKYPEETVYFIKGHDAVLKWEYSAINKTAELKYIIWNAGLSPLMFEDGSGNFQFSPARPQQYLGRLARIKPATLVIKALTFEDSDKYSCVLQGVPGVSGDTKYTNLVVTGMQQSVLSAEVGGSATFTCNATDVQSQNFTWMRRVPREKINSDARHTIVSATGSSQLTIKNITAGDQGNYDCTATIGIQQQKLGLGFLQVLEELADLKDDDPCNKRNYSAAVGEQLSISCPVSGYPPPIVTWEKNGTWLQEGYNAKLCFNTVKDKDFGMYTCTATDGKTTIGPLTIRVNPILAEIPGPSIIGTVVKAAKLEWEHQKNAEFYVVKVSGEDIRDDYLVGTQTSLEFYFHALVTKKPGERPKETRVCANVTAMNEAGVVGKTPTCQYITIKSDSDTET